LLCVCVCVCVCTEGGGIPEIKAFLNGVDLHELINIRVLFAKMFGTCFAIASGVPVGKKGPLIQIGSIIAAVVSQGKNQAFGFDISWTKFLDFRNDRQKRDFITFGTAAGVAAGFRAPIGGVLFALEEAASYWSTTLTFRTFFCGMITMLTVSLLFDDQDFGRTPTHDLFVFGQFKDLKDGVTNYRTYELFIFTFMGMTGGALGAFFNWIYTKVSIFYTTHLVSKELKVLRLVLFTVAMATLSFVLPLAWQKCTRMPTAEETASWTSEEVDLLDNLVRFQCQEDEYNELASLYFVNANQCIQSLFHFREYEGADHPSFSVSPLVIFFVSYFFSAAMTAGLAIPVGLFIPSLVAGAAYGRIWGSLMNTAFSGYVADSGTYALMGAAAINGGVTRMTLSMTIIMLETCGNMTYLLPLMVTFGAARYSGKFFADGIYDIQLHMKNFAYLDSDLHSVGLLNLNPVTEIMSAPAITLCEVDTVRNIYNVLMHTKHNGFPTLDRYGRFRGLMLRKTLVSLLEVRSFAGPAVERTVPLDVDEQGDEAAVQGVEVATCSAVFYDSLEKKYPKYTTIDQVVLSEADMDLFVDLRPYMDTSAFIIHESTSVSRTHHQLRTMGLRHLVVIDSSYSVVGMVTRRDVTNKVLRAQWESEGEHIKVYVNVDPLPPAVAYVEEDEGGDSPVKRMGGGLDYGYSSSEGSGSGSDEEGQGGSGVADGIKMVGLSKESANNTVLDEEEQF
jgi:chloride channel 7